jgi:hypothetical protein
MTMHLSIMRIRSKIGFVIMGSKLWIGHRILPDLNPIENLWKRLKDEIIRAHPELVTMGNSDLAMDRLIECAKEAWETLAEGMSNKLAAGMQKRVDAVKAAKGWYTKY